MSQTHGIGCDAKAEEDCPLAWSACGLSIAERDELTAMFWTATCVIEEMLRLTVAHHAPRRWAMHWLTSEAK